MLTPLAFYHEAEIHFVAESGKTIKVTFDPKTGHVSMEAVDEDG